MSSRDRVLEHTTAAINERIERQIRERIDYFLEHPSRIDHRLRELDEEWDVERTLETNSSLLSLFGLAMGFTVNRRWFLLPVAIQTFFLQHALQGWCPPLPILRRYGFRTSEEIERERAALKAIRGDYQSITEGPSGPAKAEAIWQAVAH